MKSFVFFGLIYLVLLPLLAISCDRSSTTTTNPTQPSSSYAVDLSLSDFSADNPNLVKDVTVTNPATFAIRLGSNASTGYEWGTPVIADATIVGQGSTQTEAPANTNLVGSAGAQIWTFKTLKAGTTTITFSYSQPWEGGQKNADTLTINLTVK